MEDRIRGRDYYLGKYYGFGENIMVSVHCTGAGGGTCRRPARRRRSGIAHSEGPRSSLSSSKAVISVSGPVCTSVAFDRMKSVLAAAVRDPPRGRRLGTRYIDDATWGVHPTLCRQGGAKDVRTVTGSQQVCFDGRIQ